MSNLTPTPIKTADVTESLKFFLTNPTGMSELYAFDDNNFVISAKTGKRLLEAVGTGNDTRYLPLALYQEIIPPGDLMVVSPYSEGITRNPPSDWFYKQLKASLLGSFQSLLEYTMALAVQHGGETKKTKGKAKEEPPHLPSDILALITPVMGMVDEKMPGELAKVLAKWIEEGKGAELLNVTYSKKMNQADVTSAFFSPKADELVKPRFPRVITYQVTDLLVRAIFGVDKHATNINHLAGKPVRDAHPKASSMLQAFYNIFARFNELLPYFDSNSGVDLGTWALHLQQMPAYTRNAMHANQPVMLAANQPVGAAAGLPQSGSLLPQQVQLPSQQPLLPTPRQQVDPNAVTLPAGTLPDGTPIAGGTVSAPNITPGQAPQAARSLFGGPFQAQARSPFQSVSSPFGQTSNLLAPASPFGAATGDNLGLGGIHPGQGRVPKVFGR